MSQPLLRVEQVSIHFKTLNGAVRAVRDVSLDVRKGECYALIGESGSGKSTLAFAAMGYLPANGYIASGRILFGGEDVTRYTHDQLQTLRGSRIGMVFQNPHTAANPCYTIGEQLVETLLVHKKVSLKEARDRAMAMLDAINVPDPKRIMEQYPHQISGGQKQRVTIAQALLCDPELIIMDEPTTALDVTTEIQFLRMLEELRTRLSQAILYITHDMGVVARLADRVGVIYAGSLVEEGRREEVFGQPMHPYTQGLMRSIPGVHFGSGRTSYSMPGLLPNLLDLPAGCVFAPRCPVADAACTAVPPLRPLAPPVTPSAVSGGPGSTDADEAGGTPFPPHRAACHHAGALALTEEAGPGADAAGPRVAEPLLVVENLKKYYERGSFLGRLMGEKNRCVFALDDVSFSLRPGETLGVVGESGCGKSTLGKALLRLHPATGGAVRYKGREISGAAERDRALCREMQIIFQNPDSSLNPRHSLYTILSRPLVVHGLVTSRAEAERRCRELLDMVRLPHTYLYRKPHQLSGGEKQRVAIARAFAVRPDFVVCDEVTSALDVSVQASIVNLLRELQREFGTSYLFISHDLTTVRQISHRIAVMYLGKIVEIGNTEQVFQPPYHPYTKALLSSISLPCLVQPHQSILLEGSIPSPESPPSGCAFRTRCYKTCPDACAVTKPELAFTGGHGIACHLDLADLRGETPVFPASEAETTRHA